MEHPVDSILKEILTAIGLPYSEVRQHEIAGQRIFSIEHNENPQLFIGRQGDTIHAIDYLVKKIAEKRLATQENPEVAMFLVDANDYRTNQIKEIQNKALIMAERARSFQYDVELSPMNGYERLIVHTTLQDAPQVKTESLGEGRNRRVVIKYAAH